MKSIKNYIQFNESSNISHYEEESIKCGEFRTNDGSILLYFTEVLTLPFVNNTKNCLQITLLNVTKKRNGVGTDLIKVMIEYAKKVNKDIVVYANPIGPYISKEELIKFYTDLGFVEDKCKNIDSNLNPQQLLRYKVKD